MLTTKSLEEVASSGIIVNLYRDLVYTRQRVHDGQIFLCVLKLFKVEDVAVLQSYVILFVEESFLLDPGHVEDVKFRHGVFKGLCLVELSSCLLHIFDYVFGNLQFFR